MNNNEKRAHDLTLVAVSKMFDIISQSPADNEDNQVVFDFYFEYVNIYSKVLESFNRDFPVLDK